MIEHFRTPATIEGWADAATLSLLALMWWVMLWYAIRRTWRWERLGVALTVVVGCLAVSYTFSVATIFVVDDLWIPSVRWSTRAALFAAGTFAILVMRFDEPPKRREP